MNKFIKVVELAGIGFISDFIPALKFVDRKKLGVFQEITDGFNVMLKNELEEHQQHFDASKKQIRFKWSAYF